MRLKPKHVRRLTLLAAVGGILVVVAFALIFVRGWQTERLTARYRAQALAAFEKKDYYTTLVNAGSFLQRGDQRDPEILLAYSEARANLHEFDGHHITDAIKYYVQYLDVRPDDSAARLELVKLYNLHRFHTEAAAIAKTMRPPLDQTTLEHFPVMKEEAFALVRDKAYERPADAERTDDAEDLRNLLDRMLVLDPKHPSPPVFLVQALSRMDSRGSYSAATYNFLEPYIAANPELPAAMIASAAAKMIFQASGWRDESLGLLARAAGLNPETGFRESEAVYTDAETPLLLVQLFDGINEFELSLQVMRDAEDRLKHKDFKPLLVRRLWQNGLVQEVEARSRAVDLTDITADPVVLAFRALALTQLGKGEEAAAILAALKAREGDYRTSSWAKAIPLADATEAQDHVAQVETLRTILKTNPIEPVFHVWLGNALAALGRNDEARAAWREAVAGPEGRPWAFPWVRTAETLLNDGRLDEARQSVGEAIQVVGGQPAVAVLFFEIEAARVQRVSADPTFVAGEVATLLSKLKETRGLFAARATEPGVASLLERLIVPEIIFLSRSGEKELAKAAALEALNSGLPLNPVTAERLTLAIAVEQLGITVEQRAGMSSGEVATVAFGQALDTWARGDTAAAIELLRREIKDHPESASARIALPRFLEIVGDKDLASDTLAAWKDAGEAFKDNLGVQRACLGARALARDPAFVEATIVGYRTLAGISAGSEDRVIRFARARALLEGQPDARARDRAIALIRSVIDEQPRLVEAKLLLASALSLNDRQRNIRPDLPRAIAALTEAYTLDPSSVLTSLELARLHQLLGQFDRAREYLYRVAQNRGLNWKLRLVASEMLVQQGDIRPVAQDVLGEIAQQADAATLPKVLVALAEIHETQREQDEAARLYDQLSKIAADGNSIFMTARHYALRNQPEREAAVLARMDGVDLSDATKETVRARLAAAKKDWENAAKHFELAISTDPKMAELWRHYAGMYMRDGQIAKAAEVATRGVAANPEDLNLAMLQDQAKLLLEGVNDPDLQVLVASLVQTPILNNAAPDIVKTVKELRAEGKLATAEDLSRLADRFSGSPAVQIYAADRMRLLDPARAAALVNRAIASSPTDPTPARLAAEIYLQMQRWNDLIAAATAWRDRDASRSPEPDLAMAQAYLGLKRYKDGLASLRPHLDAAKADPANPYSPGIINIYAKLLIKSGLEKQALEELSPVFQASPVLRISVGMNLAGMDVPTYESSREWLRVLLAMTPEAEDQRLAGANVLAMLATRFSDKNRALYEESRDQLIAITTSGQTFKPVVWELLGIVHTNLGENDAAKPAYRKAIELDGERLDAMNNLAFLLMNDTSEGALDEALALAKRAVEAKSNPNPNHMDTLAAAHKRKGQQATDPAVAREHYLAAAKLYWRIATLETQNVNQLRGFLNEAMVAANVAGDYALALSAVERILGTAGMDPQTTAMCRNNEAAFLLQLRRGRSDLERARSAAQAAVSYQESPSFLDTLGWAHLALGSSGEARNAFERAIKATATGAQPPAASVIGLAMVLVGQGDEGRARASTLVAGLDISTLDQQNRSKYDQLKIQLDAATP